MRKWFVTAVIVAIACVSARADVTVTQTMTMEGAAASMMSGASLPKITLRIKGKKSRAEIEMNGQVVTAISDLEVGQVIVLDATAKTAKTTTAASIAGGAAPLTAPDLTVSFKPTGKSQVIDGQQCEEFALLLNMGLAHFVGEGQMPPETAAMMKDIRMAMNGSVWVSRAAPGASEFAAFNKAAVDAKLLSLVTGMASGKAGGIDKLLEASASAPGLPYLTEISLNFEGTGPIVEAMKQMGPMKMIQKLSSVSTDSIADDMFKVPEGYTIAK
jgi:hypothetical protein